MNLLFFCPRWGSNDMPWRQFLTQVKTAGFDGVEIGLPQSPEERQLVFGLLQELDLKYILQHYETNTPHYSQHKVEYIERVKQMLACRPYLVNSHTGRDFFSVDQNNDLLAQGYEMETLSGIPVLHETHRSRFSYAAHVMNAYLKPDWVKLTLDISHWFCVAETLLYDQEAIVQQAIEKSGHIHARIGHEQGPQVYDFRNTQWAAVVNRHLEIWDRVMAYRSKTGRSETSITTEFGPWPYMPSLPEKEPAPDYQFQINTAMMTLLKERYKTQDTSK